jgi:hypothetical protein
MSGTTDFTSTTSRHAVVGWNARTVDRTALPAKIERDLRERRPTTPTEQFEHSFDQLRVPLIQQPIQALSLPEQADIDASAELGRDSFQGMKRDPRRVSALDTSDDRSRGARPGSERFLAPAAAMPERA